VPASEGQVFFIPIKTNKLAGMKKKTKKNKQTCNEKKTKENNNKKKERVRKSYFPHEF